MVCVLKLISNNYHWKIQQNDEKMRLVEHPKSKKPVIRKTKTRYTTDINNESDFHFICLVPYVLKS